MKRKIKKIVLASILLNVPLMATAPSTDKTVVAKDSVDSTKKSVSNKSSSSVWAQGGSLTNLGKELIEQIDSDKTVASDLPFYKLYRSVKNGSKTEAKLNKLYYSYMNYLIKGGINWSAFDADINRLKKKYDYNVGWERVAPPYSAKSILNRAKLNGTFGNAFSRVEPKRFKYKKLKKYLEKYIAIRKNGGWKTIKGGTTLRVGASNPNIPIIRKRLKLVGDLNGCSASMDSTVYDSCMGKAVKRFRLRHGFKASSVIDRATRAEFKKPVSYYIKKMRLNLDRIKWSKRDEARVRIELNIPAFRLYLYDGKDLVTTMRVITGKPDHPTPIFSDVMTTVVVNPYWRIPESIVRKEMIKRLLKNPHHYEKQGKYLYKGWGPDSEKINPATVNWKQYLNNKKHIPYHFMQKPGSHNALGKIKFLFPNKYSVYIHDTPGKRRFFNTTRAFSHGCMRIQKPRELLKALSLYNSNIHVDSIMKRLGTDDNKQIGLRRRIPVDITYFTSFVDDYGNLHFRNDIYGYDRLQLKHYASRGGHYPTSSKAEKKLKAKSSKKTSHKKKVSKKVTKKAKAEHKKHKTKTTKKTTTKKKSGYEVIEIGY